MKIIASRHTGIHIDNYPIGYTFIQIFLWFGLYRNGHQLDITVKAVQIVHWIIVVQSDSFAIVYHNVSQWVRSGIGVGPIMNRKTEPSPILMENLMNFPKSISNSVDAVLDLSAKEPNVLHPNKE
ncbi:unnamed protein product [Medioppia subpectinata]|uniref:Uncharacterized protein n=1 Tax=Medioppia subpectinata TaxID=1979941 RepID=A0A7R9KCK2_9ACAR|nr:unnamed protein product [Medioppia subpectinata]CAG2101000.1 unnamed protein product [Medioppia subpectinata]